MDVMRYSIAIVLSSLYRVAEGMRGSGLAEAKSISGKAESSGGRRDRRLSRFQPLEFEPVAADVCKVVLRLLHKPAFFDAAENLGQPHCHFRRYAALPVY